MFAPYDKRQSPEDRRWERMKTTWWGLYVASLLPHWIVEVFDSYSPVRRYFRMTALVLDSVVLLFGAYLFILWLRRRRESRAHAALQT